MPEEQGSDSKAKLVQDDGLTSPGHNSKEKSSATKRPGSINESPGHRTGKSRPGSGSNYVSIGRNTGKPIRSQTKTTPIKVDPGPSGKPSDPLDTSIHHQSSQTESAPVGEPRRSKVLPIFQAKALEETAAVGLTAEEGERIPDAWFADHGDVSTRVLSLRARRDPEFAAEVVLGRDDRVRVDATTEYPYACICSLTITAGNGKRFLGTGWLTNSCTVITAGHCVFSSKQGGWARQIAVSPGRNGSSQPLGPFISDEFYSVRGWVSQGLPEYDYAAIILPKSADDADLESFAYGSPKHQDLRDELVQVVGYPGDKPIGTLWGHATGLSEVAERTLVYNVDTFGGNSGGPVFIFDETAPDDESQFQVIGIHNYGDLAGNSATRITRDVFKNIQMWSGRE